MNFNDKRNNLKTPKVDYQRDYILIVFGFDPKE